MMGWIYILLQIRESAFRMKEIYKSVQMPTLQQSCAMTININIEHMSKSKRKIEINLHGHERKFISSSHFELFLQYSTFFMFTYISVDIYTFIWISNTLTINNIWHIWIIFRASELHSLHDWRYSIKHST